MEKCDFDRQFLWHSFLLNFFSNFTVTVAIKSQKPGLSNYARIYFCMLNIERPIAHQSSITFFLIHPVYIIAGQKQRKDTVIVKQSSYESCITLISHAYTSL